MATWKSPQLILEYDLSSLIIWPCCIIAEDEEQDGKIEDPD